MLAAHLADERTHSHESYEQQCHFEVVDEGIPGRWAGERRTELPSKGQVGEDIAKDATERDTSSRSGRLDRAPSSESESVAAPFGQTHGGGQRPHAEESAAESDEERADPEQEW